MSVDAVAKWGSVLLNPVLPALIWSLINLAIAIYGLPFVLGGHAWIVGAAPVVILALAAFRRKPEQRLDNMKNLETILGTICVLCAVGCLIAGYIDFDNQQHREIWIAAGECFLIATTVHAAYKKLNGKPRSPAG